ncbi:MAG: hypothetical protein KBC64_04865 [Simkaniaceae bacterium]|nr:hypothetical protein [Simkaniaceae bacterium]
MDNYNYDLDDVFEPFQEDLSNLIENLSFSEENEGISGIRGMILRLQRAIILLIQYGDWPHFSFPLALERAPLNAKEVFGVTEDHLALFYERARDCFERQNYGEASDLCFLLAKLEPQEVTYWVALGMSEQLKGNYKGAATAYSVAMDVSGNDLTPGIYAARCLIDLGEISLARALLVELLNSEAGEGVLFSSQAKELIHELEGKK